MTAARKPVVGFVSLVIYVNSLFVSLAFSANRNSFGGSLATGDRTPRTIAAAIAKCDLRRIIQTESANLDKDQLGDTV